MPPTQDEVLAREADVYSPKVLRIYDPLVLGFCNRFVWRCRSSRMLERYNQLAGGRHLDVGVGTGWFLDRCRWPVDTPAITLLDLSEHALAATAERIGRYAPRSVRANVLEPVSLGDARFDSIACNYLLHCVPGEIESKSRTVVANLEPYLADGGVLFGSTILGRGVRHNAVGRKLMRLYNAKGIFANTQDDRDGLERGLGAALPDVDVEIVGAVALFSAKRPA